MPRKPGGCNRSHIPKALEHPTGLPNPQPSHEPPAPGPLRHPSHLSQIAQWNNNNNNNNTQNYNWHSTPKYLPWFSKIIARVQVLFTSWKYTRACLKTNCSADGGTRVCSDAVLCYFCRNFDLCLQYCDFTRPSSFYQCGCGILMFVCVVLWSWDPAFAPPSADIWECPARFWIE